MAFLGLFKKKAKKVEDSSIQKLTSVSKQEKSIGLPTPPERSKIGVPPSDIPVIKAQELPPIKAPEISLSDEPPKLKDISKLMPPKSMPPIKTPETISFSNIITPTNQLSKNEGGIISPKAKLSTHSPIQTEETEPFKPFNPQKKEETKLTELHKEELPEFKDVRIKGKEIGEGMQIPTPPNYLSHIGEAREGVAVEGIFSGGLRKPIFVEINDYRKVIGEIKSIKKDSKKSKELVRSLDDFKMKNLVKMKKWEKGLEKIQSDLIFMDKILFEENGAS